MPEYTIPAFGKGEVDPKLFGRVDTAMYQQALRQARNMMIHVSGGASNRPGTLFIGPVKDMTKSPRLIPFQFNTEDQYMLEFGDQYIRFVRNDGVVTETSTAITAITQADPAVVSASGHGFSNGDEIFVAGIVGMTELNNRRFIVAGVSGADFDLTSVYDGTNIDSTGYTAYGSVGTVSKIFELVTPYAQADLDEITFTQSADTMTITHESYEPRDLTRTAHTTWSLDVIDFQPTQVPPTNVAATALTTGSTTIRYKVTALSGDGFEESLAGLGSVTATITNITKADPAVVTTSAVHDYDDGDEIEITGVVGMTEVNGRRFRVIVLSTTTFSLEGEDSTDYSTYSSVGTCTNTFVEITDSQDFDEGADPDPIGHDNIVTWTRPTGPPPDRYAVYKYDNGRYGVIGETVTTEFIDKNIAVDFAIAPPRASNPFFGALNWPRCSTYYQQRQVFGGTINAPDTLFFSQTGARLNMTTSTPIQDDDAMIITLASRQVNEIRSLTPRRDLLCLTSGSEWRVHPGEDTALSPSTIKLEPQSEYGAAIHRPIVAGQLTLFVEDGGSVVRSLGYDLEIDGYGGTNLTLLASHLFSNKAPGVYVVADWAYSGLPEPLVFCVRTDGKMCVMTLDREQQVLAWSVWDTRGEYERVGTLRRTISDVEDGVYFVVRRRLNGNTVRYIERLQSRKYANLNDGIFLDASSTRRNRQDITGIVDVGGSMQITITAHGFSNGDTVCFNDICWELSLDELGNPSMADLLNGNCYTVAQATANTFKLIGPL